MLAALSLHAQSIGPEVYRKKQNPSKTRLALSPPGVMASLPSPPRVELSAVSESDLRSIDPGFGPERVGLHRKVPALSASANAADAASGRLSSEGWTVLPGGTRVWRMAIHSPGAAAIRAHFEAFDGGDGRLWIYSAAGNTAISTVSYQGRGPNGDGDFWSDLVFSDTAIVEFLPGPSARSSEQIPFRIGEISHLWRDLITPAGALDWNRKAGAGGTGPAQAAPCSLDLSCFPEWSDTARAVARIVFETSGGSALCSGTLLNDICEANRLYFLTAAHCISDQAAARSLIAFWSYQTSVCNGAPPSANSVPRTFGSTLLIAKGGEGAPDPKGDFALLLLDDAPDNALLSGWNAGEVGAGVDVTGIHHPRGDYKRITFGRTVQDFGIPEQFLRVAEFQGRTQNGSSGSGVFSEPGVLIGDLSFGPKPAPGETECDISPGAGGYQRLSLAYADLQPFLEGSTTPPPPEEDPPGGDLSLGGTDTFTLDAVANGTLFTGEFAYTVEAASDVTRIRVAIDATNPSGANIDLFVRRGESPTVSNGQVLADFRSISPTGHEEIVIDASSSPPLAAGTYFVAIAALTVNTPIEASIQVTLERAAPPAPPTGVQLSSGQAVEFSLPSVNSPTLFTGTSVYTVNVPDNVTRLDVSVDTSTQGADVDLYVRFGTPPEVQGGQVVADASSSSFTGDELLSLTRAEGLRSGTYYIALALFSTGVGVRGLLKADLAAGTGGNEPGIPLSPAAPQNFSVDPVAEPTFFSDLIYRVDVGEGAARLTVDLETSTANVDIDLFVRFGEPPDVSDGQVLSTYSSEGLTGREQVVISAASSPPLRPGSYFVGLVLFSTGQAAAGRVRVTLEQAAAGAPHINAATNAASFAQEAVAPGQIITLFGTSMGPAVGVGAQLDPVTGRLASLLGGVRVLFDSVPAPLFFVRADQINVQVPYDVAGQPSTAIAVLVNGDVSNALRVPVAPTAPGLFLLGDGTSHVVAQRQNGSIVSAANPAQRGEVVVLYATGEGLTNPPARDGTLAPGAEPLQRPIAPVAVRFGGVSGELFFAGSAPGFAGLLQLNVRVPAGAPTGAAVPVELTIGAEAGQPGASIAVQ